MTSSHPHIKLKQIHCTQCKAPLDTIGNLLRSRIITCQYCGTVMDTHNDFKALYAFKYLQKSRSSLTIGMEVTIREITFTIAGLLVYKSNEHEWFQFELYSPTHGYSWLTEYSGELIFFRRTFYLPDRNLWMMKQGKSFTVQKRHYHIKQFHFAEVIHAEGTLIARVKPGSRSKQCFAVECHSTHQDTSDWYYSVQNRDATHYYSGLIVKKS